MMQSIYNFVKLSDNLFSSGMPTPEQIPSIGESGVQVVINLATSKSEGWMPNEKDLVEAQRIKYYNIPVDWDAPTTDNLNEFANIMEKHKHDKILVHCQANFRAMGFILLHRVNHLGWGKEEAFKDLLRIWNPADYPIWKIFIETNIKK